MEIKNIAYPLAHKIFVGCSKS